MDPMKTLLTYLIVVLALMAGWLQINPRADVAGAVQAVQQ